MLAPARPLHQRDRELGEEHEALHRHRERLVHLVRLHRQQREEGGARRVGHQRVEPAERLGRPGEDRLQALRLELVRPEHQRPPPERRHLRLERARRLLVPPVGRHHVPPLAPRGAGQTARPTPREPPVTSTTRFAMPPLRSRRTGGRARSGRAAIGRQPRRVSAIEMGLLHGLLAAGGGRARRRDARRAGPARRARPVRARAVPGLDRRRQRGGRRLAAASGCCSSCRCSAGSTSGCCARWTERCSSRSGLLLGVGIFRSWMKSPSAQATLDGWTRKLQPYREKLGVTAMVLGAYLVLRAHLLSPGSAGDGARSGGMKRAPGLVSIGAAPCTCSASRCSSPSSWWWWSGATSTCTGGCSGTRPATGASAAPGPSRSPSPAPRSSSPGRCSPASTRRGATRWPSRRGAGWGWASTSGCRSPPSNSGGGWTAGAGGGAARPRSPPSGGSSSPGRRWAGRGWSRRASAPTACAGRSRRRSSTSSPSGCPGSTAPSTGCASCR